MRGVTLWFGFSIVLILAIDGFPLGTPQLIYQKIIPGVGNAKTIDPLITQEAAISGFLTGPYYTDISLPQILMVDTAGTHMRCMEVWSDPRFITHRYSPDGDSLFVYTLCFWPDHIFINYLHVLTDSVEVTYDSPYILAEIECVSQKDRIGIQFRKLKDG